MLKAGILMPRSTLYPSLGLDIVNGLKECLKQQQIFNQVNLVIDNIGFGTDEPDIYSKAEKMLLQDGVDMVILCADSNIADMLHPLFTASNKILLVVNFGANLPVSWQAQPTTIIHSLNFCLHTKLTGKSTALETDKQAAYVVSYYDGGYNLCYCMLTSHQVNGGVPVFNHITHLKLAEFTLEPLAKYLADHKDVKTLLCLFAGEQAEKFYEEISVLQKEMELKLFVSPMMLDESLKEMDIQNVHGFIPWHSSLKNEANDLFKNFYPSSAKKSLNYFSLLGWETGLLLASVYQQHVNDNTDAAAVVKSLTQTVFNSPRGWLKIDPATHHSYGPSYMATGKNKMEINIEYETENMDEVWEAFTKDKLIKGESAGWRNTYLCI